MINLCLEFELFDKNTADRLLCFYDRYYESPFRIIIRHVDEQKLYQAASKKYEIPMIDYESIDTSKDFSHILTKERQEYFNCLIIGCEDDVIQVITWNFFKTNVLPHALNNLTGKTVELYLINITGFDKLKNR